VAQAEWVAARLDSPSELVRITTAGDRASAVGGRASAVVGRASAVGGRASVVGDKSRWVSELERALLAEEIDLAVHSAKDVPSVLADGLELVAFPERADPRDVICGVPTLEALPAEARVGTSSLRRTAQLRALRPDLVVAELRGNVDTRLRKLASGEVDALVLALAGLQRLERAGEAGGVLDGLVPAAGQGALALEARAGSVPDSALAPLRDPDTTDAVSAERDLVRRLGASCNTPVGAFGRAIGGGRVQLDAWVGLPDGSAWVRDSFAGPASEVGAAVAERLVAVGAGELLARAEREVGV
jgi:hydroxymethylbilane synthase